MLAWLREGRDAAIARVQKAAQEEAQLAGEEAEETHKEGKIIEWMKAVQVRGRPLDLPKGREEVIFVRYLLDLFLSHFIIELQFYFDLILYFIFSS